MCSFRFTISLRYRQDVEKKLKVTQDLGDQSADRVVIFDHENLRHSPGNPASNMPVARRLRRSVGVAGHGRQAARCAARHEPSRSGTESASMGLPNSGPCA